LILVLSVTLGLATNGACSRRTVSQISTERKADKATAAEPGRYKGQPMLIVLENYALAIVGELPPNKEESMREIVKRAFGGGSDWRETVRRTMGWRDSIDEEIRQNWETYKSVATAQGRAVDAVPFAQAFADAHKNDEDTR